MEIDAFYVKNVIVPLEHLIQELDVKGEQFHHTKTELDHLLLERYVTLENMMREECCVSNSDD